VIKTHLGWIEGFPATGAHSGAVPWVVVATRGQPEATSLQLDRKHLAGATRAIGKLRGELSVGFARVVADPQKWLARIERLLALLKAAVHRGAPLPANLFEVPGIYRRAVCATATETLHEQPRLGALVAALSWSRCVRTDRVGRTLAWVAENGRALSDLVAAIDETDAVVAGVRLAFLADAEGRASATPLLAWLGDPRAHAVPLGGGAEHAREVAGALTKKRAGKTPIPSPTEKPLLGGALLRWLSWVVAQDSATRRRALRLFGLVMPENALGDWAAWWHDLERDVARGRRAVGRSQLDMGELRKVRARLRRMQERAPHALKAEWLLDEIQILARAEPPYPYRAACDALGELPGADERGPLRALFLLHWGRLARVADDEEILRVPLLLRSFADYLHAGGTSAERLRPWAEVFAKRQHGELCGYAIDDDLVEHLERRADWPRFFAALDRATAELGKGLGRDVADTLAELVAITHDEARAAELFLELHRRELSAVYISPACIRVAVAAGGDDPALAAALIEALRAQEYVSERALERTAGALVELFRRQGSAEVVRELMLAGQSRRVLDCGRKLALLSRVRPGAVPRPEWRSEATALPAWTRRYPSALADSLRLLCASHGDSRAAAARILARDLPDPDALRAQIAGVEARLARVGEGEAAGLERRLRTLRDRLRTPRLPSPARLERLAGKLRRAATEAMYEDWEERLDAALRRWLPAHLGMPEAQEWMFAPATLAILPALSELRGNERALARTLLVARAGERPWDLREAEQNRAFVASLERRGIDPRPWIDGIGEVECATPKGERLRLALEEDPIEVLAMGAHFDTCLSPGAFNFFSALVNAVDINKRVLYARTSRGAVAGRCLLALTGNGGLLAFHPYAHDTGAGFDDMVRAFARDLAARMHTVIVPSGEVPTLLASRWYDDGPIDLTGQFTVLAEGSSLRASLAELDPAELPGKLEEALRPLGLNEHTLPMVLGLPEMDARPELVLALMPSLDRCEGLADETRLRAALLADRAGAREAARRLFGTRAVPYLLRMHREQNWLDPRALGFLVDIDPGKALMILRATRPRGVRSLIGELSGERLYAAARASDALHRPAQALRLYERAAEELYGQLKEVCLARIRELRAARDEV